MTAGCGEPMRAKRSSRNVNLFPGYLSNINASHYPQLQWESEPLDQRMVIGCDIACGHVNDDAAILRRNLFIASRVEGLFPLCSCPRELFCFPGMARGNVNIHEEPAT